MGLTIPYGLIYHYQRLISVLFSVKECMEEEAAEREQFEGTGKGNFYEAKKVFRQPRPGFVFGRNGETDRRGVGIELDFGGGAKRR